MAMALRGLSKKGKLSYGQGADCRSGAAGSPHKKIVFAMWERILGSGCAKVLFAGLQESSRILARSGNTAGTAAREVPYGEAGHETVGPLSITHVFGVVHPRPEGVYVLSL